MKRAKMRKGEGMRKRSCRIERGTSKRNDLRRARRSLCVSVSEGGSAYEGRREVEGRGEGEDDDEGRR